MERKIKTLSEQRRFDTFAREHVYPEKDVKEFLIQEGYLLQAFIQEEITWEEMCDKRRKLFGGVI